MPTAKSSSFFITERVNLTASGTRVQDTIDLGAYVDAADAQGLAIESVDFIVQGYDATTGAMETTIGGAVSADLTMGFQVVSNDPGTTFLPANDHRLIASGQLFYDQSAVLVSGGSDIYPDNFGKGDQAYYVINDQLYVVGDAITTFVANHGLALTVRIRCRVVKLTKNDWMAIAIQSTSQDN